MKQVQGVSRTLCSAVVAQRWKSVTIDLTFKKTKRVPSYFERHEGEDLFGNDQTRAHDSTAAKGFKFHIAKAADFVKFCKAVHGKEFDAMFQHTRELTLTMPMYTSGALDKVDAKASPRGLTQKALMWWLIKRIPTEFPRLARVNISAMYWTAYPERDHSLYNELVGSLPPHVTQNIIVNSSETSLSMIGEGLRREIASPAYSKDGNLRFLRIVIHHQHWHREINGDADEALDILTGMGELPESLERLDIVSPEAHILDIDYNYTGAEGQLTKLVSRLPNLKSLAFFRVLFRPSQEPWGLPPTVTNLALTDITELSGCYPNVTSLRCYGQIKDDNPNYKKLGGVFPNLESLYLDTVEKDGLKVLQDVPASLKTLRVMYAKGVHWKLIQSVKHIPNLIIDNPAGADLSPKAVKVGAKSMEATYESLTLAMKKIEARHEPMIEQLSQMTKRLYLSYQSVVSESFKERMTPAKIGLCCNLLDTIAERGGQNYWTKTLPKDFYEFS
ncbi:hypothetical protein TRVA0_001S01816 [Trichomonascus vanleenenianus]|uniref:uncharacterized protein n=1 Tax=Trichomonascus vanleenenianus TaxID=2268995 RepID=UPI003ECB7230